MASFLILFTPRRQFQWQFCVVRYLLNTWMLILAGWFQYHHKIKLILSLIEFSNIIQMFSLDIKTPDTKLVAIWRYNTYEKNEVHASTQYDYVNRPVVGWLTHWGRVTHIFVGTNTNIGSDNGLSPDRRQAIIWTNARILLIAPLEINFIQKNAFQNIVCEVAAILSRPQCVNVTVPERMHESTYITYAL